MDKSVALGVTMTADASDVDAAFESVGDSAKAMATEVSQAADKADTAASRLSGVGDAADTLDSKSAAATGALGALSSGFELVGLDQYAGGLQAAAMATDFASGAGQALNLVLGLESVQRAKSVVQAGAHAAATVAASVATKAATAGQWLLNAALAANPVGAVVAGVLLLVGAVVLAYQRSETFRNIVQAAMGGAKTAVGAVVDVIKDVASFVSDAKDKFPILSTAVGAAKTLIVGYFDLITTPIRAVVTLIGNIVDAIGNIKFPDLPDWIKNPPDINPFNRAVVPRTKADMVNGLRNTGSTAANDVTSTGGITLVKIEAINPRDLVRDLRRLGYQVGGIA